MLSSHCGNQSDFSLSPAAGAQRRTEADGTVPPGRAQTGQTTGRNPNAGDLLPGTYDIILCVDFIETTG